MLNKVLLQGRLCYAPEAQEYGDSGKLLLSNVIAVQRDKEHTNFIRFTAFGKTAEMIQAYISKGDMFIIDGSLDVNQTEEATYTTVLVNSIQFCPNAFKEEPKQEKFNKTGYSKKYRR